MESDQKYDEALLLAGLSQGNEMVFKQVFNRYYAALVYFAGKYIQADEAEDIVAGVFTRFWLSQPGNHFNSVSSLKSFLYVSTRNACFDLLKQQSRQRANDITLSKQWHEGEEPDTGYEMEEAELLSRVYREIEKLPARCREVFKLSYLEGKSTEYIARSLNITPSTVFNQKARAIQLLKMSFPGIQILFLFIWHFL